jgi:undecaprenyl-diphosphatase
MWDAALWGLIQGLTEFLPVSSSGHLVLVPALLNREGPDLATTAVLHLGTLAAALVYFRTEVSSVVRLKPEGRRLLRVLVIGTIPAVVFGLAFRSQLERLNDTPRAVAAALLAAGGVLVLASRIHKGSATIKELSGLDAVLIGAGQALAVIPGVTRSGMTIAGGASRSLGAHEAARFAFLLGIPVIAGTGLLQLVELAGEDGAIGRDTLIGLGVAAVVGYGSIAGLLRIIGKAGLRPFGLYCVAAGALAFVIV